MKEIPKDHIFVFGSNEAGRHGAGAARYAMDKRGARYGQGVGLAGTSYAIPTKDTQIETLPLRDIKIYVEDFKDFALHHPGLTFVVTRIGCGLAGYTDEDIGPLFKDSPPNVVFYDEPGFDNWEKYR